MDKSETRPDPDSILGLSTDEIAGLTPDELTGNPTAIKMLLHYYKQLQNDNTALRNNNNTLETYVAAYDRQKSASAVGAVLLATSNVTTGFGVNLLTAKEVGPGLATLIPGVVMAVVGLYFTLGKSRG